MKRKTFVRIQEAVILVAALNLLMAPVQLYANNPLIGLGNFFLAFWLVVLVEVTNRWERRTTWDKIRAEFSDESRESAE